MITGDGSVGTGFLVRPGIIATNAHVIDGEFMTTLRVRFPSAEKAQQVRCPPSFSMKIRAAILPSCA